MVIIYLFAALLGAFTTSMVLSSYGWLVALLGAPLGGGALALALMLLVAWTERAPTPEAYAASMGRRS